MDNVCCFENTKPFMNIAIVSRWNQGVSLVIHLKRGTILLTCKKKST